MLLSAPTPHQGNLWAGRTVGLLGGSFNPAHEGHRHISLYALKALGVDAVWWMVSPQNPLKDSKETAPINERVEKAKDVSNHSQIVVTDIETHLDTQYTADTLRKLKQHFPDTSFVWLMGTDNLQTIHKWQEWEEIFNMVPIAVFERPPRESIIKSCPAAEKFKSHKLPKNQVKLLKSKKAPAWTVVSNPLNSLSSTEIRAKSTLQNQ